MTTHTNNLIRLRTLIDIADNIALKRAYDPADVYADVESASDVYCDASKHALTLTVFGDRNIEGMFMLIDVVNRCAILPEVKSTQTRTREPQTWMVVTFDTCVSDIITSARAGENTSDVDDITTMIGRAFQSDAKLTCISSGKTLVDAGNDLLIHTGFERMMLFEPPTQVN